MAVHSSGIDAKHVTSIIQDLLASFHSETRKELSIEDVIYEVKAENEGPINKDGYPENNVNAQYVINNNKDHIVYFRTDNIAAYLSNKFSKFTQEIFNEISIIYVKFIFAHELVHARQVRDGLTKEEYKKHLIYKDNPYEIEANTVAMNLLRKQNDPFTNKIIEIIYHEMMIDNDIANEIGSLYYRNKREVLG